MLAIFLPQFQGGKKGFRGFASKSGLEINNNAQNTPFLKEEILQNCKTVPNYIITHW